MKHSYIYILIVPFLLLSCSSSTNSNTKSGWYNLDDLLTEPLLSETFDVPEGTEFDKKLTEPEAVEDLLTYSWETEVDEHRTMHYQMALNFANTKKMSESDTNEIWQRQNENLYKRHNLQPVEGAGDKASWSTLGGMGESGGQLRVAYDGYIFYVSMNVFEFDEEPIPPTQNFDIWSTEKMIEKGKELANGIIANMNAIKL